MFFSRLVLGSAAVVLLASCGGGESTIEQSPDPFISFRVNGVSYPTEVSATRVHYEGEDAYNPCDPSQYENAQDVVDNAPGFCVNEITSASVVFSIQYFNAGYESRDVTYTGQGFTIHIYKYDETQPDFLGEEVWNSDYYNQIQIEQLNDVGYELDNFDPYEIHTVTLGPGVGIPDQRVSGSASLEFRGNKLFEDGYASFDPTNFRLAKVPADLVSGPLCNWGGVISTTNATLYEKVFCQTENLLLPPSLDTDADIKYIARVRFNFDNWQQQPEDVVITLGAPKGRGFACRFESVMCWEMQKSQPRSENSAGRD